MLTPLLLFGIHVFPESDLFFNLDRDGTLRAHSLTDTPSREISPVMMPVTSYLVVENEAQKAALKKKQEQVLSSKKLLEPRDDTQRMSEPGLWLLAILFGLVLVYKQKRKRGCSKGTHW